MIIDSLEKLEALLNRHPYLYDRPAFQKQYHLAKWYIIIKKAQQEDTLHDLVEGNLHQLIGISEKTLTNWLDNRTQPSLLKSLIAHEKARCASEASLHFKADLHRINPSYVYEHFRSLRDSALWTPESLADAIESLYNELVNPNDVVFAELSAYHERGPIWLRRVSAVIKEHQADIELFLNTRFRAGGKSHCKLRVGVTGNRLFIWQRDTNPDNWLNLYSNESFHFHTLESKVALIRCTYAHLNLRGNIRLSELVRHLTNFRGRVQRGGRNTDLFPHKTYLKGETLHFLLSATNKTLEDIRPLINYIGKGIFGRGRVFSPLFPSVESLRTRLYATMICDGHLDEAYTLGYGEGDYNRREYVRALIRQLGDVEIREKSHKSTTYLYSPAVVGRLLKAWGMPIGDKALQEVRLPRYIIDGSVDVKCAYFQEIVPEDGNFYITDWNRGRFQWARAIVLDAGVKAERYQFKARITEESVAFIRRVGNEKSLAFSNPDKPARIFRLTWGKLSRLTESKDSKIGASAQRLMQCILGNPCHLVKDEVSLCRSIGIGVNDYPVFVTLFEKSGRVSVQWQAQTGRKEDAMRFGLLAPPMHKRKFADFKSWATSEPEILLRVTKQLQREELNFQAIV